MMNDESEYEAGGDDHGDDSDNDGEYQEGVAN